MSSEETCPFLISLENIKEEELLSAWMAYKDWMLGPRRPEILAAQS